MLHSSSTLTQVTAVMDFDKILTQIGEFGRFQQRIYYPVNILAFPVSAQMLVLVFAAAKPEWICSSSQDSLCQQDGHVCSGAKYTSNFTSIATEWDLVCGDSYKVELIQSLYMAGTLFGGALLGSLADKYGRKRLWIVTYIGCCVFALFSAVATSYLVFAVMRFLVGFFVGGAGLIIFVLTMESVGPSYRGLMGTVQQAFSSIFIATLGGLAYMVPTWRLQITLTITPAIIQLLLIHKTPESPRWLASQGRYSEAEEILHHAAVQNGKQSKTRIKLGHSPQSSKAQSESYGILDVLTHKVTCLYTIILSLMFFVNSLVYYGLSLNVKNLGGSLYVNFVLAGLVELPSLMLTVFLISWSGRRKTLFFFMIGAAASCFMCMKLQESDTSSVALLSATAMSGKFFISGSFAVLYVYSSELLPTIVRNSGLGFASIFNRFGGICCPFVVLLGEYRKPLPMLVFSVCAAIVGVIGLKFPETKGKPLPETFDDVEYLKSHLQDTFKHEKEH